MKKLLLLSLLLMGIVSTVSADNVGKQLYIIGDEEVGNGWNNSNSLPNLVAMTYDSSTGINTKTVTISSTTKYFAIGDVDSSSSWGTFNSTNRYAYNGDVSSADEYELEKGEISSTLSPGTYKISINSTNMKMTISLDCPLYICGASPICDGGMSVDDKPNFTAMTQIGSTKSYYVDVELTSSTEFCISRTNNSDMGWDNFNNPDYKHRYSFGTSNATLYGGQFQLGSNGEYSNYLNGNYRITVNSETMVMTITKATPVTLTIKNVDPTTWSSIYLYTYGTTYGNTLGTWSGLRIYDGTNVISDDPRVAVTKNGNTYSVQLYVDFDNLIVNKGDGSGQVEDKSFEDGRTYIVGSYPSTTPSSYKTVYYVNDDDWDNIHLYGFYSNGVTNIAAQTAWTGYELVKNDVAQAVSNNLIKVTKVGVNSADKSIYKVEIGDDRGYDNIIFNDGVNNSGNQTSDIIPAEGKYYISTGDEVASPAYKIAPAKKYTTYVTPDKMDFSDLGIKAYIAESADASSVTMTDVTTVPANTPLLLKKTDEETTYTVPVAASAADIVGNKLVAGDGITIIGGNSKYDYILSNGMFYRAEEGTVAVGKAYLHLDSAPADARELTILFSDDDETDGINAVKGMMSEISGESYNLAGQKVSNDYKGIVIVNGKKVVRK